MIAYVLDKQIGAEVIISDIEKLIKNFHNQYPDQTPILVIDIKGVSRDDTSLIPKLEHNCTT